MVIVLQCALINTRKSIWKGSQSPALAALSQALPSCCLPHCGGGILVTHECQHPSDSAQSLAVLALQLWVYEFLRLDFLTCKMGITPASPLKASSKHPKSIVYDYQYLQDTFALCLRNGPPLLDLLVLKLMTGEPPGTDSPVFFPSRWWVGSHWPDILWMADNWICWAAAMMPSLKSTVASDGSGKKQHLDSSVTV